MVRTFGALAPPPHVMKKVLIFQDSYNIDKWPKQGLSSRVLDVTKVNLFVFVYRSSLKRQKFQAFVLNASLVVKCELKQKTCGPETGERCSATRARIITTCKTPSDQSCEVCEQFDRTSSFNQPIKFTRSFISQKQLSTLFDRVFAINRE